MKATVEVGKSYIFTYEQMAVFPLSIFYSINYDGEDIGGGSGTYSTMNSLAESILEMAFTKTGGVIPDFNLVGVNDEEVPEIPKMNATFTRNLYPEQLEQLVGYLSDLEIIARAREEAKILSNFFDND